MNKNGGPDGNNSFGSSVPKHFTLGSDSVFRVGVVQGSDLTGTEPYAQMTRTKRKRMKKKRKREELRKMNMGIGDNYPANMKDGCLEKGLRSESRQDVCSETGSKQAVRVTSSMKEAPLGSGSHIVPLVNMLVLEEGQHTLAKDPFPEKNSNRKPAENSSSLSMVGESQPNEQLTPSQTRSKRLKENKKKREQLKRNCVSTVDNNPLNMESDCFQKGSPFDSLKNSGLQSGFQGEENSSMKYTPLENDSQLIRSQRKRKRLKENKNKREELNRIGVSTVDNNPTNMESDCFQKGSPFDSLNNSGLQSGFQGEENPSRKYTPPDNDSQLTHSQRKRKRRKENKKKREESNRICVSTVDNNPTNMDNDCFEKDSHFDSVKNSGLPSVFQVEEDSSMKNVPLENDSQLTSSQRKIKRQKENRKKRAVLKSTFVSSVDNNPANMKTDGFERGSNFDSLKTSGLQSGFQVEENSSMKVAPLESDSNGVATHVFFPKEQKEKDLDLKTNIKEAVPSAVHSSLGSLYIGHPKKKLLILDLNGILVDVVMRVDRFYKGKVDMRLRGKKVFKRPFCDDFIKFCFERFNVGIWSSRVKINAEKITKFLFGESVNKLLFCWNRSHCTVTKLKTLEKDSKPLVLKELRKLWEKDSCQHLPWEKGEYDESNTLLVDDSPYKALRNPAYTTIFPYPYDYNNVTDGSLGYGGDIQVYLEGLAKASNVQKYVEENPFGQPAITESDPSWNYYSKVLHTGSSQN